MSNYFQTQSQQPLVNGGASFAPYNNPYFPMQQQQRLPVYNAAPIHGENAGRKQRDLSAGCRIGYNMVDQDGCQW